MSTRGILQSSAVGQVFALERRPAPDDLADLIDNHWIVSWDLRGRAPYLAEVLPHPSVHVVFEPGTAAVYGVHRQRYVRRLSGSGWAVGTKFLPGGFASFTDRPVSELTDGVFALDALFGADGDRVARQCASLLPPAATLPVLHALLRSRRRATIDPRMLLIQSIVREMHDAPPGTRISTIAERRFVSIRTLQRLFATYVGVGPKWVLKRYRLHDAIEQMDRRANVDWTRFALDLGYYDHAHFNHDFRALVGRTPAQYELEAST